MNKIILLINSVWLWFSCYIFYIFHLKKPTLFSSFNTSHWSNLRYLETQSLYLLELPQLWEHASIQGKTWLTYPLNWISRKTPWKQLGLWRCPAPRGGWGKVLRSSPCWRRSYLSPSTARQQWRVLVVWGGTYQLNQPPLTWYEGGIHNINRGGQTQGGFLRRLWVCLDLWRLWG